MSMVFALVLLGCADDGTQCRPLATRPERYASEALCQADQYQALESDVARRADYPTVLARCLRADARGGRVMR